MEGNQSADVSPAPDKSIIQVRYANSKFPRTPRVPLCIFLSFTIGISPEGLSSVSRETEFCLEFLDVRFVRSFRLPLFIFKQFYCLPERIIRHPLLFFQKINRLPAVGNLGPK